jgi:hypothetical protein
MLASCPVSTVNQNAPDSGIPTDSAQRHPALDDLVRPHLEADKRIGTEGVHDRDRQQHHALARLARGLFAAHRACADRASGCVDRFGVTPSRQRRQSSRENLSVRVLSVELEDSWTPRFRKR